MKTKETGKYTLLLAVFALIMMLGYPVLAGTASSSALREQTVERAFADASVLLGAVKATGARVEEIQVRMKWDGFRFQTAQEAEIFLQAIAKTANIDTWRKEEQDGIRIYRGESTNGAGMEQKIYVTLHSPREKNEITGGLGFTFRGKENQVPLIKNITADYVRNVINSSELPQFISCIRGKFSGKLENDLQKKKASQLLASLEGTMVESLEEETVLSYSAYSPQVNTMIETNHRSMNLQVAMHYDTYMQGTMITAGIPIITAEY